MLVYDAVPGTPTRFYSGRRRSGRNSGLRIAVQHAAAGISSADRLRDDRLEFVAGQHDWIGLHATRLGGLSREFLYVATGDSVSLQRRNFQLAAKFAQPCH